MKKSKKPTSKDPAELGQMLLNIYESGYLDVNQSYKQAFIKGVVSGVGGIIGATVVVGLLVWALSFFGQVPLVGKVFRSTQHSIQSKH